MQRAVLAAAILFGSGSVVLCAESPAVLSPLETAKRLAASKEKKDRVQSLHLLKALGIPGTAPGDEALAHYGDLCLRFCAEGEKAGLEEARRSFTELQEKSHSRWGLKGRVGLFRVAAAEGKREEAVRGLDRFLQDQGKDDAFLEAAYYLGCLYAESGEDLGQLRRARGSLGYALKLWGLQNGYYAGSLSEAAIRDKLAGVNSRIREIETGEPKLTFQKAEQAKEASNYAGAIALYEKVIKEHPQHALCDLSGLRLCECLGAKGEPASAIKRAKGFIAQKPLGPYRGQAHLLVGDLLLECLFDADGAEEEYAGALWPQSYDPATGKTRKPADGGLNSPAADESWKNALADGHERYGLCLYMRREFDAAGKHFAEELRLRPTRAFAGRQIESHMQCLLRMCREKRYPVYHHEQVMNGDRRVQTLLFLASAYSEAGRVEKALLMFQRAQGKEFAGGITGVQFAYSRMEEAECLRLLMRESEAIKVLQDFDQKYAAAPFAPMALMEKAKIYLTLDDKPAAFKTYAEVLSKYPAHPEAAKAAYLAGYVHYIMKEWKEALNCFELLTSRYPGTKQAEMVAAQEIPDIKAKLAGQERIAR